MNNPGLDEPISNDAKDVEQQKVDEDAAKEEHEQAFLEPNRYWFASTAFPLIAGTFGPMASTFSICALAVQWRVSIPEGVAEQNGIKIDDPKWLIAINAVQLVIALISNLALLLNMAKRLRFAIAQPITIIGWYLSSLTLISLTACAAGPLKIEPSATHAFTQAYYYAIIAAALYFMVATLMVVTVWGAYKGHFPQEFQLTMSQRTLMLQTILYFVYLLCGAVVFSYIEGWKFLDAVYWADFTLLTVGIGDYSPATHLGRSLLFPYAIGGIIILGLVIGSIRSLVLERGKEKMSARMVEKERRRLIKRIEKKNKSFILEPITDDKSSAARASSGSLPGNERERREKEFHLMRRIQQEATTKRRWTSLAISGATWFLLWFAGAAVFQATEYGQNWTYFGSLYFSYTSLLTIGYGDFYPQSNSGKPFFVFWSLLAVPSLTILISNMGDTIVKMIKDLTLWIGTVTVLPGEHGVRVALKDSAKKVTRGRLFKDLETPPGILGESNKPGVGEEKDEATEDKNALESAAQDVQTDRACREKKHAQARARGHQELPKNKHHYHHLLIQEISEGTKHLNANPPREYGYDEWAWYLKLIGEDEDSADTHRKALRNPKIDGEGLGVAMSGGKEDEKVEWSWVGNRSPLMGIKGEAEWVLERLTAKLEEELAALRREEEERERAAEVESEHDRMEDRIIRHRSIEGAESGHGDDKDANVESEDNVRKRCFEEHGGNWHSSIRAGSS